MKSQLIILSAMLFANQAFAQIENTNVIPIVTTNTLTVMPWYREVDGKVYDPKYSKLWKPLNGTAEIKKVFKGYVVYQFCYVQNIYNNEGLVTGQNRIYGKKFILRNDSLEIVEPGPDGFEPSGHEKVGSVTEFRGFIAMYVGTMDFDGQEIDIWDCGTKVRSQTVTVISTNYPKIFKKRS